MGCHMGLLWVARPCFIEMWTLCWDRRGAGFTLQLCRGVCVQDWGRCHQDACLQEGDVSGEEEQRGQATFQWEWRFQVRPNHRTSTPVGSPSSTSISLLMVTICNKNWYCCVSVSPFLFRPHHHHHHHKKTHPLVALIHSRTHVVSLPSFTSFSKPRSRLSPKGMHLCEGFLLRERGAVPCS